MSQARLDAIRFLNAAIKQREIELREGGGPMNDQEVIKVIGLGTMIGTELSTHTNHLTWKRALMRPGRVIWVA